MIQAIRKTTRTWLGMVAVALAVALAAPVAQADDYERDRAGHPVRVLAYVLHPFGVMLDFLVMRPAHWLGHQPGFKTLFGHQDH
ncbi:MAG: hypothetical protein HKP30_04060 [Myxococcales bacterium]|nr:hypothetical protein [Myxococcales bacterium]